MKFKKYFYFTEGALKRMELLLHEVTLNSLLALPASKKYDDRNRTRSENQPTSRLQRS